MPRHRYHGKVNGHPGRLKLCTTGIGATCLSPWPSPHQRSEAMEGSYCITPMKIGTKTLRAIQTTTAAPLAECARMLATGEWKGVVFQSQLDPDSFMNGPFVSMVYGGGEAKEYEKERIDNGYVEVEF